MNFFDQIMNIWDRFCAWIHPTAEGIRSFFSTFGKVLDSIWRVIFSLRKVFAAIPVGAGAILLAIYNSTHLPGVVGIGLQNDGTYLLLVVRILAVLGPLAITAFCLLLMFISKKILTPWLVSLFTLVIPPILLLVNSFPY